MKVFIVILGIIAGAFSLSFTGYALFASKSELKLVEKQVENLKADYDTLRIEIRDDLKVIRSDVKKLLQSGCKDRCGD